MPAGTGSLRLHTHERKAMKMIIPEPVFIRRAGGRLFRIPGDINCLTGAGTLMYHGAGINDFNKWPVFSSGDRSLPAYPDWRLFYSLSSFSLSGCRFSMPIYGSSRLGIAV